MPEARERLPGGVAGEVGPRFGLRPGFDIAAAARARSVHERILGRSPLSDNKENIPPESSTSSRRRRTRPRKSPLPSSYPRTPLRDVTAAVNAMERRRSRIRAAAELSRRNQERANSSPFPLRTSPLPHERNDSEPAQTPIQDRQSSLSVSGLSPDSSAIIGISMQPAERPPESSHSIENPASQDKDTVSTVKSSDSIDEIGRTENSASQDKNTIATEKTSDSIDEIGRIVMENFQRMENKNTKTSKGSTLMSMR